LTALGNQLAIDVEIRTTEDKSEKWSEQDLNLEQIVACKSSAQTTALNMSLVPTIIREKLQASEVKYKPSICKSVQGQFSPPCSFLRISRTF